jgi:hypothetical protein
MFCANLQPPWEENSFTLGVADLELVCVVKDTHTHTLSYTYKPQNWQEKSIH